MIDTYNSSSLLVGISDSSLGIFEVRQQVKSASSIDNSTFLRRCQHHLHCQRPAHNMPPRLYKNKGGTATGNAGDGMGKRQKQHDSLNNYNNGDDDDYDLSDNNNSDDAAAAGSCGVQRRMSPRIKKNKNRGSVDAAASAVGRMGKRQKQHSTKSRYHNTHDDNDYDLSDNNISDDNSDDNSDDASAAGAGSRGVKRRRSPRTKNKKNKGSVDAASAGGRM